MKGTLKSMLELTGDSQAYTGNSGTESNPWAVEDIYDLCNLSAYNGASSTELSYVRLVNNIDFNHHNEFKYGCGFKKLNISGANMVFDGNNKEIRNLYLVDRVFVDVSTSDSTAREYPVFWFYNIHDTNFVNVVMERCKNYSDSYSCGWVYATINEHNSYNIFSINMGSFRSHIPDNMNECTFNIRAYQNNPAKWGKLIKNSLINIDFKTGSDYIFNGIGFDHCVIQGKVVSTSTSSKFYIFGSSNVGNTFSCNFLNIETNKPMQVIENTSLFPSFTGISIINKSAFPSISSSSFPSSTPKVYALSEADCKNTEILSSKGFPVVEG